MQQSDHKQKASPIIYQCDLTSGFGRVDLHRPYYYLAWRKKAIFDRLSAKEKHFQNKFRKNNSKKKNYKEDIVEKKVLTTKMIKIPKL